MFRKTIQEAERASVSMLLHNKYYYCFKNVNFFFVGILTNIIMQFSCPIKFIATYFYIRADSFDLILLHNLTTTSAIHTYIYFKRMALKLIFMMFIYLFFFFFGLDLLKNIPRPPFGNTLLFIVQFDFYIIFFI